MNIEKLTSALFARSNNYSISAINLVKSIFTDVKTALTSSVTVTDAEMKVRYEKLRETFSDEMRLRWKNYLHAVQFLWVFTIALTLWSVFVQNWIVAIEAATLFLFVWVGLGYRIWIAREKLYPGFVQYLHLFIHLPMAAVPLKANNLMGT